MKSLKRIQTALLALCLALTMTACGGSKTPSEPESSAPEPESSAPALLPTEGDGQVYDPVIMEYMRDVATSLNIYMTGTGKLYDPDDDAQFWEALAIVIGNSEYLELQAGSIDKSGDTMEVPEDIALRYASVIRPGLTQLPEAPAEGAICRSVEPGYLTVRVGDAGMCYGRLATWEATDTGYDTLCELVDAESGEVLAAYRYSLLPNTCTAEGIAGFYEFSIGGVEQRAE